MSDEGINNVFAYEAASHEGGYVNGVMAGMLTKSNVIGVVGPIETGDAKLYIDGFVAGVKASNPDARGQRQLYRLLLRRGPGLRSGQHPHLGRSRRADRHRPDGGGRHRRGRGEWRALVRHPGQPDLTGPSIVVANQVYDWTVVLNDIIDLIGQGTYGGKAYNITLENKGQVMEYNPDFDLPADVKAAAEEAIQGIIDGSITIDIGE